MKGGRNQYEYKLFTELSRVFAGQSIATDLLETNCLVILLNGHPACRVHPDGMLYINPEDLTTPEAI